MNKTKILTTSALMVALAAIISLTLYFIPLLQFAMFLIGIPIIVLGKLADIKLQALATLIVLIILAFIDPTYALLIGWVVLPLGVIQGYLIGKSERNSKVMMYGAIAMVFGFLGFLYSLNLMFDINFVQELQIMIDSTVDQTKTLYETMNMYTEEELARMFVVLEDMRSSVVMLLPAMVMLYSLITSILSFVIAKRILKSLNLPIEKSYFKDFRIDNHSRLILMIILGMITLVSFIDSANATYYITNFLSIFNIVLQINALAFIWYLLEKHPNKKGMKIATAVLYITSPLIPGLSLIRYILSMIGFVDMFMNFRLRIESRPE